MNTPQYEKVIFFFRGDFPNGSNALRTRNMMKGLSQNGIDSELLVTYPPPEAGKHHVLLPHETWMLAPKPFPLHSIQKILYKLVGTINGYSELKKRKDDITAVYLTAPGFFEGYLVRRFCGKYRKRFLVERGDVIRWKYSEAKITFVQRLAVYQDSLFDRFVLKHVECLFVVSSFLERIYTGVLPKEQVKRILPALIDIEEYDRLKFMPIPAEILRRLPPKLPQRVRIVYAGSCLETNGLRHVLQAADNLHRRGGFSMEILMIMNVGLIDEVASFAGTLTMREHIHIVRNLLFSDIPAIYDTADILVIPEMGDEVANAGFPSKVSECLASGKAVIATHFSDLSDYLIHEQNSMVSPVGDLSAYEQNLARLVNDEELRKRLGMNAKISAVTHFENSRGVKMLVDHLRGGQ